MEHHVLCEHSNHPLLLHKTRGQVQPTSCMIKESRKHMHCSSDHLLRFTVAPLPSNGLLRLRAQIKDVPAWSTGTSRIRGADVVGQ